MDYNVVITAISNGDKSAERLLFNHLAPELMFFCKRYAIDDHQAKDFFQECFIRVFDKISQFNIDGGKFKSWFFTVSRNVILGHMRKSNSRVKLDFVEQIPESAFVENDLEYLSDDELVTCIRQLPDGYRTVINLYVFEKMKHREIAELLNITEATSRSQYKRAKQSLKALLIKRIPDLYERKLV